MLAKGIVIGVLGLLFCLLIEIFRESMLDTRQYRNDPLFDELVNAVAVYVQNPIRIDITEVSKFCLRLIGENIHFGDNRDTEFQKLIKKFDKVRIVFLGYFAIDETCFWVFFQNTWLLHECQILFGRYNEEVLEDIRRCVEARGIKESHDYDSKSDVEVYYQISPPSGWRKLGYSTFRSAFYTRYTLLGDMERYNKYAYIFWDAYFYEKENNHLIRFHHYDEYDKYDDRRNLALITYLRCLSCVLDATCTPVIRAGYFNTKQWQSYSSQPHSESEQKHDDRMDIDISRLVNIGLSRIGRKTKTPNPYITPEQTKERQRIERPFLKLLADNYKDEATRKTLAQYFMLYKEMLLFLIYAMTLKKNPVLHSEVKGKLIERLSEGLSPEAIKKRNSYWRELSKTFYESYRGTQDIGHVLEDVFWGKLPKKVNPIAKCGHDSLYAIFDYTRKAIARELR